MSRTYVASSWVGGGYTLCGLGIRGGDGARGRDVWLYGYINRVERGRGKGGDRGVILPI